MNRLLLALVILSVFLAAPKALAPAWAEEPKRAGQTLRQEQAKVGKGGLFNKELTEDTIIAVIKNMKDAHDRAYVDPHVIKWNVGSFTGKNKLEAVVYFIHKYDVASLWEEWRIWLLRYEGKWSPVTELVGTDYHNILLHEVVDIDNDGILEIWLVVCGGNQGYFYSKGMLISLAQGEVKELSKVNNMGLVSSLDPGAENALYHNEGFDKTGAGLEGMRAKVGEAKVMRKAHKTVFIDIDSDGVLEILDIEEKMIHQYIKPKEPYEAGEKYTRASSTSKKSLYKLKDGRFKETKLPPSFKLPERISWKCLEDYSTEECFYISGKN